MISTLDGGPRDGGRCRDAPLVWHSPYPGSALRESSFHPCFIGNKADARTPRVRNRGRLGPLLQPDGPAPNQPPKWLSTRPGDLRSEERRVGKECRSRWSPYH